MKIYIKDMEMPKCCGDCKFLYDSFCCIVTGELMDRINWQLDQKKLSNCPLVPISPHGDLIDRDELRKKMTAFCDKQHEEAAYTGNREVRIRWDDAANFIEDAPVVIPAEKIKQELKPCPFCGEEADTAYNTRFNYQAFCTNENCFMNTITMYGMDTEQDAIEAWNKREKDD